MTTWLVNRMKPALVANRLQKPNTGPFLRSFVLITALIALAAIDTQLFHLVATTLSDVYLGVSVFVALTLALFYFLNGRLKNSFESLLLSHRFLQVPIASFLGALPGCGGAIIVVTQYANGQISFGALVAVLISTMGDAAFLLLAQKPEVALLVYSVSLVAGIVFGYAVELTHKDERLPARADIKFDDDSLQPMPKALSFLFLLVLVPSSVFAVAGAFQIDTNAWFGIWSDLDLTTWLGFTGSLICLIVWLSQPLNSWSKRLTESSKTRVLDTALAETSFVSVWVVLGFLSFELLLFFTGLDLAVWFEGMGGFAILLATLIGFIPGCGPQIITTTLYLNGLIPLSAQLANAISNDGDALFPAIALAPKAALKATIYTAIPAILIGYLTFSLGW